MTDRVRETVRSVLFVPDEVHSLPTDGCNVWPIETGAEVPLIERERERREKGREERKSRVERKGEEREKESRTVEKRKMERKEER